MSYPGPLFFPDRDGTGRKERQRRKIEYDCFFVLQDSYGDTVLHDAIAKDFIEIVEVLVNFRDIDLSIKNKRGFNCLHHAALKGNARSVAIFEREKKRRGGGVGWRWGLKKGMIGWGIDCLFRVRVHSVN